MTDSARRLVQAARIVAAAGLSDAFGHVSERVPDGLLLTAPLPLAHQSADTLTTVGLHSDELPADAPREAWIHVAIARVDAATGAVCRAQPRAVARAVAAGRSIRPLDGHGALLGTLVPVYPDSRLVRDAEAGARVARALGDAPAIVLRGNGAVTRGPDLPSAVARMWLLERSAELALVAPASGPALPDDEQAWWRERDGELLARIYDFLVRTYGDDTTGREKEREP